MERLGHQSAIVLRLHIQLSSRRFDCAAAKKPGVFSLNRMRALSLVLISSTRCKMAPLTKEVNGAIAIASLLLVRHRRRRQREFRKGRLWVQPHINEREEYGAFYVLLPALRKRDDEMYRNFLRMPAYVYDWLLEKITPYITKKDTTYLATISNGDCQTHCCSCSPDYVK